MQICSGYLHLCEWDNGHHRYYTIGQKDKWTEEETDILRCIPNSKLVKNLYVLWAFRSLLLCVIKHLEKKLHFDTIILGRHGQFFPFWYSNEQKNKFLIGFEKQRCFHFTRYCSRVVRWIWLTIDTNPDARSPNVSPNFEVNSSFLRSGACLQRTLHRRTDGQQDMLADKHT